MQGLRRQSHWCCARAPEQRRHITDSGENNLPLVGRRQWHGGKRRADGGAEYLINRQAQSQQATQKGADTGTDTASNKKSTEISSDVGT
jgi:hypothetical protein